MYDIEIDYTTGSSFGSERITNESVGIVTTSLEKATENLKRIRDHYKRYRGSENYGYHDEWYEISLLTDDGERKVRAFWIGYFEKLHSARIVGNDISFEL